MGDLSRTARDIAIGALNYWLLQVTAGKDMTFDPRESISFNGNTGPYLQYTRRAHLQHAAQVRGAKGPVQRGVIFGSGPRPPRRMGDRQVAGPVPRDVVAAARDLNPSVLTAYLFELCKGFSRYYQDHPVLRNDDQSLVQSRISLVRAIQQVLRNGLELLGIPFLEAM